MKTKTIEYQGKTLDVEKNGSTISLRYKGKLAAEGKSLKKAREYLARQPVSLFLEACDKADEVEARNKLWEGQAAKFKQIFGFEPPQDYLIWSVDKRHALELPRLYTLLKVPEGTAPKDYIAEKYGQEASDLCEEMI